ncbi:MAG: hypothetical protein AAFY71_20270 [Bacteroidota bacterium]
MEKLIHNIQIYVSVGYIYLLALGVIHDVMYYGFFGINIMSYVGVQDILVSPIAYMTENWRLPVAVVVLSVGIYFYGKFMAKKGIEKYHQLEREGKLTEKIKQRHEQISKAATPVTLIMLGVLSMYLGAGLGSGNKRSGLMEAGKLSMNQELTFMSGDKQVGRIIGQTTSYLFYVREGEKSVTVLPIQGNVMEIQDYDEPEESGKEAEIDDALILEPEKSEAEQPADQAE